MSYVIVTSFNKDGYKLYAKDMLKSFKKFWKKDIELEAWYHDCKLPADAPKASNITYKNLNNVKDMLTYKKKMAQHDGTNAGQAKYDWRRDAIKWCHKVYAMTEAARNRMDSNNWLIWLDADTVTYKPVPEKFLPELCKKEIDILHLGRTDIDYSETSFLGFNLRSIMAKEFLEDMRGCYNMGETTAYREWHDGFIFDRLLKIHMAHGLVAHNLTPAVKGLDAFNQSPLTTYLHHFKGNKKFGDINASRYSYLYDMIKQFKAKRILETGTWNGGRAIKMAEAAFTHTNTVQYIGYDLFGLASTELDKKEFNTKKHHTLKEVSDRLNKYTKEKKKQGKVFEYVLNEGDTKETLKEKIDVDFVFIDGGHSYETVKHDFEKLKHNPQIVLDDFFLEDDDGKKPSEEHCGVNKLFEEITLPKKVLKTRDPVISGGIIGLGLIAQKKKDLFVAKVPIVVRPVDSASEDHIHKNVTGNSKLINKWITKTCASTTEKCIIASAGASLDVELIRRQLIEYPNAKLVCVKHSYPTLLKAGIKPWACTILDPRPITGISTHGIKRKDLFKTVDPSTLFLVASMTDTSVTKFLQKKKAQMIGWHAYSEAIKKGVKGLAKSTMFITGGTNAAMRSVGIMHTLGFRDFILHGFDYHLKEKPKDHKKLNKDGLPEYLYITVNEKQFWTTGELLAGAQDLEKFFDQKPDDIILKMHSGGIGKVLWETQGIMKISPTYKEMLYG